MDKRPRRMVILAQYDTEGGVPAHVRIHLERLRPVAERLVLVSNSPISPEARTIANSLCDRILERENKGWDFAAWRDALLHEDMSTWDWVVLTNSSVIGPLFPLAPVFTRMEARGSDFWGMVSSEEKKPHLQSYFLTFSSKVITSNVWQAFWAGVGDHKEKQVIIDSYEVQLTEFFETAGFRSEQVVKKIPFPQNIRLVRTRRIRLPIRPVNLNLYNKSVYAPLQLIRQGVPYLKASLLWGKSIHQRTPLERIRRVPGLEYPWTEIGF